MHHKKVGHCYLPIKCLKIFFFYSKFSMTETTTVKHQPMSHHCIITKTSQWARWCLKSPIHHCLLNRLFRRSSKKTSKHWWPVNSLHKSLVTREMFPFDDVIMIKEYATAEMFAAIIKVWRTFLYVIKPHPHNGVAGYQYINSLRPSDLIWQQRPGSTLAQAMVCCLTASNNYLNYSWPLIGSVPWHSHGAISLQIFKALTWLINETCLKITFSKLHQHIHIPGCI